MSTSKLFSASPLIMGIIEDLEIGLLRPFRYNYRSDCYVDDILQSIREVGLLQPILVRNMESYYEIVAGHRRYEACKRLGWRKIICHILDLNDRNAYEISLIENIQRKTLNPIDEAQAYRRYVLDFGWGGISDLAARIGKSVSYVDKRLKLLDLPLHVIQSISDSTIKPSTAEELLAVKDKIKQSELGYLIKTNKLSFRDTREIIGCERDKRDSIYDYNDVQMPTCEPGRDDLDKKSQRSFDKSIIVLRTAMNKLSSIIEEAQDNWVVYEILMHHKNIVHNEIDLLIKEKRKA